MEIERVTVTSICRDGLHRVGATSQILPATTFATDYQGSWCIGIEGNQIDNITVEDWDSVGGKRGNKLNMNRIDAVERVVLRTGIDLGFGDVNRIFCNYLQMGAEKF